MPTNTTSTSIHTTEPPTTTRFRPVFLIGTYLTTLLGTIAVSMLAAIYVAELPLPLALHFVAWGLALGGAVSSPRLARRAVEAVDERLGRVGTVATPPDPVAVAPEPVVDPVPVEHPRA